MKHLVAVEYKRPCSYCLLAVYLGGISALLSRSLVLYSRRRGSTRLKALYTPIYIPGHLTCASSTVVKDDFALMGYQQGGFRARHFKLRSQPSLQISLPLIEFTRSQLECFSFFRGDGATVKRNQGSVNLRARHHIYAYNSAPIIYKAMQSWLCLVVG